MSDALVAFLRARLDEDERTARAAQQAGVGGDFPYWIDVDTERKADAARAIIEQFNPKRELAEVDSKRHIIDAYDDETDRVSFGDWTSCSDSCPGEIMWQVFRLLALPYASHPDYDEAWRP